MWKLTEHTFVYISVSTGDIIAWGMVLHAPPRNADHQSNPPTPGPTPPYPLGSNNRSDTNLQTYTKNEKMVFPCILFDVSCRAPLHGWHPVIPQLSVIESLVPDSRAPLHEWHPYNPQLGISVNIFVYTPACICVSTFVSMFMLTRSSPGSRPGL